MAMMLIVTTDAFPSRHKVVTSEVS